MDYIECPFCGRAYTWSYLYGSNIPPMLDREHTVVCDGGHEFAFAPYLDKEGSMVESLDLMERRRWWAPWTKRDVPILVTVVRPRVWVSMQERNDTIGKFEADSPRA